MLTSNEIMENEIYIMDIKIVNLRMKLVQKFKVFDELLDVQYSLTNKLKQITATF